MKTVPASARVLIAIVVSTIAVLAVENRQADTQEQSAGALSVCEVLASPNKYVGKTITLTAILAGNEEFWAFSYGTCQPNPTELDGKHPLIAPSFGDARYDFHSPIAKKLNKTLKKKHRAQVTVVGTFTDPGHYFGHQLCCRYELEVERLVSVERVSIEK
jgi:hypothetical protein